MSRLEPFAYAFAELADVRFPDVRREAEARHTDLTDRAAFAALPAVQRILADVEAPELIQENPQAADEYLTTLYVAFRFWDAGRAVCPVSREAIERALARDPPATLPAVPGGACYMQLPERWFWARIGPEEPHEPLDGFFVITSGAGREMTVLAVLGLRLERSGFSQLSVRATPQEMRDARLAARTPPFASVLEGGDRAGVRSLVATGELVHLAQVALLAAAG